MWERLFVEVGGGRVGRLVLGESEIKVGCMVVRRRTVGRTVEVVVAVAAGEM